MCRWLTEAHSDMSIVSPLSAHPVYKVHELMPGRPTGAHGNMSTASPLSAHPVYKVREFMCCQLTEAHSDMSTVSTLLAHPMCHLQENGGLTGCTSNKGSRQPTLGEPVYKPIVPIG